MKNEAVAGWRGFSCGKITTCCGCTHDGGGNYLRSVNSRTVGLNTNKCDFCNGNNSVLLLSGGLDDCL